jgi:hypothetical protein
VQQEHRVKSLRVQGRVFFSSSAHISYFHPFQHRKLGCYLCVHRTWVVTYVLPPLLFLFLSDSAPTQLIWLSGKTDALSS